VNLYDGFRTDVWTKVVSKRLPSGSWAVVATVNTGAHDGSFGGAEETTRDLACELRNGDAFIGGATDRRVIPVEDAKTSLSMNGGAQVPTGGGEVSLWCKSQMYSEWVNQAQIMFLQVGGFS
jgi:hypothetical protein